MASTAANLFCAGLANENSWAEYVNSQPEVLYLCGNGLCLNIMDSVLETTNESHKRCHTQATTSSAVFCDLYP